MSHRTALRALTAGLLVLAALTAPLAAQSNTAELLQRAIHLYEQVEIEQALVILRQVISPSSPFEVSREQRVQAYKYLGAVLALEQGAANRDSAIVYFRAAIERDPWVDLDPHRFSPAQLSALAEARNRTFAVAVRPVQLDTLDPGNQTITFRSLTSHRAALRAEIRLHGVGRSVLYDGDNDGLREIPWDGFLSDGTMAPPGRYEMAVIARSGLLDLTDTASVFFDVAYDHQPLEDTLLDLAPGDLLPERRPASAATADLLKGLGVAAAALLIPSVLTPEDLGAGRPGLPGVVASVGAIAGVVAFFVGRAHREIPVNLAENQRRLATRRATNAAIAQRNAEILRRTRLVITPAGGGS